MKVVAVLYPGGPAAAETPELLGCAENALGLRPLLESAGHELVALTDTGAELDSHLATAEVLIATPFWPTYITRERIERAPNLRLLLTAGVGSDHFDLAAAAAHNITVAEITGSNVVSVAEHVVMQILTLVRNYLPSYQEVLDGGWDIGKIAAKSHDLEDKSVGIVGMGRIGQRVAARLKPFDVRLRYFDYRRMTTAEEHLFGARYSSLDALLQAERRGEHQHPADADHPGHVRPHTAQQYETWRLLGEHCPRADYRHRRVGGSDGSRTLGRLRRRRVVSSTGAGRPPLAPDAQPRHDSPRIRDVAGGAETLRRRHPAVPDKLYERQPHRPRLHHRRERPRQQSQLQLRLSIVVRRVVRSHRRPMRL